MQKAELDLHQALSPKYQGEKIIEVMDILQNAFQPLCKQGGGIHFAEWRSQKKERKKEKKAIASFKFTSSINVYSIQPCPCLLIMLCRNVRNKEVQNVYKSNEKFYAFILKDRNDDRGCFSWSFTKLSAFNKKKNIRMITLGWMRSQEKKKIKSMVWCSLIWGEFQVTQSWLFSSRDMFRSGLFILYDSDLSIVTMFNWLKNEMSCFYPFIVTLLSMLCDVLIGHSFNSIFFFCLLKQDEASQLVMWLRTCKEVKTSDHLLQSADAGDSFQKCIKENEHSVLFHLYWCNHCHICLAEALADLHCVLVYFW